ncbi:MAG: hypothetical protein IT176_07600 [Acidobacteria bacterium]|nr:hypothetical protein [Acidobacteriota bacterium]
MTDRLYYADSYLREFDARVVRVSHAADRLLVTLDRTAFYPTSGGQMFDAGTLGPHLVVDVIDEGDGDVAHAIEASGAEPPAAGDPIHGAIDWARRFEHMQQHTGQHVLSAAFQHAASAETVSVHLGATSATIDLAREVPPAAIAAAEEEANRVVWENRPVAVSFVAAGEAARLPLRKRPDRTGTIRLVAIRDVDLSACGGTHVAGTGEIGSIAIAGAERFRGGTRIEFLCGIRALRGFRSMRDTLASAGRLLSTGVDGLGAAIEHLQVDVREQKRATAALQSELLAFRSADLIASAEPMGGARVVRRALDADAPALKALALQIASAPGHAAVLLSASRPALVVVARAADLPIRADQILSALMARFGGRGGGRPDLAQGGGLDAPPGEILAAAGEVVSR